MAGLMMLCRWGLEVGLSDMHVSSVHTRSMQEHCDRYSGW